MMKGIMRRYAGTEGTSTSMMHAHPTEAADRPLALESMCSSRTSDWIIDFGAAQHVTGDAREFSSYTRLAATESIQTVDATFQLVIGKGEVNCSGSIKLSNVLHAPSFPFNLLFISSIIIQLKCTVSFDIPKVTFQEKETRQILGTVTWHDGLWYLNREGLDAALISVAEKAGVGDQKMSAEDILVLYH